MGNIIGNPFNKGVKDQINVRQEKLGLPTRDNDTIKWTNNTNAFLRLASSVNIDETISQKIIGNTQYAGSKLAEACFLYNGVTQINNISTFDESPDSSVADLIERKTIQQGINQTGTIINDGAYGFGGLEMGYRPMPGLEGAQVSFYNRGSLKNATVQIKAFTPKQFEIIEALYMRVGFTVLLEWGHTQYLDTNEENALSRGLLITPEYFSTQPLTQLFTRKADLFLLGLSNIYDTKSFIHANIETMLAAIRYERKEHSYNYDALYGKVKNFNWSFNPDGTYSITINIVSHGDVIESLNINRAFTTDLKLKTSTSPSIKYGPLTEKETNNLIITTASEVSDNVRIPLIGERDNVILDYNFNKNLLKSANNQLQTTPDGIILPEEVYSMFGPLQRYLWLVRNQLEDIDWDDKNVDLNTKDLKKFAVKIDFINNKNEDNPEEDSSTENTQYYIKLGQLLRFIEENMLYYDNNENRPIIKIDYDYNNNFCLTYPQQFPADPNVCLIPLSYVTEETAFGKYNWNYLTKELGTNFFEEKNRYIGNLMHLHVNFNFILSTYNNVKNSNKKGKVALYRFLQNLLDGISNSLGGVNDLEVTYNNETNKIIIRDNNNLRYGDLVKKTEITEFNIYGFDKGRGSIINSINFNVSITPQFATMVSIGAQSNGNVVGENATMLSTLYSGSHDRILVDKVDTSGNKDEAPKEKFDILRLNETLHKVYNPSFYNTNPSNIKILKALSSNYAEYITGYLNELEQIPALGFFPFDLELKMQGISGIRNYEKFKITDRILPSLYRDEDGNSKMDFLIKGITHDIKDNKWETTINTLSVPRSPEGEIMKYSIPEAPQTEVLDGCGLKTITLPPTRIVDNVGASVGAAFASYRKIYKITGMTRSGGLGEAKGLCARYVYNLARGYENYLNGGKAKLEMIKAKNAGNNANNKSIKPPSFWKNLTDLGYKMEHVGKNISREEMRAFLGRGQKATIDWHAGDIAVYFGKSGDLQLSPVKYGHAQFYLGGTIGETSSLNSLPASKWASSVKNNYGSGFIYNSYDGTKNKPDINCWDLIIFRSPGSRAQTDKELAKEIEIKAVGFVQATKALN